MKNEWLEKRDIANEIEVIFNFDLTMPPLYKSESIAELFELLSQEVIDEEHMADSQQDCE